MFERENEIDETQLGAHDHESYTFVVMINQFIHRRPLCFI